MIGNSPTRTDSTAIAAHRAREVNAHRAIVTASFGQVFLSHRISFGRPSEPQLVRDSRSDRKSGAKVIQRSKKILGPWPDLTPRSPESSPRTVVAASVSSINAYTKRVCTHVPEAHIRRSQRLARSASSTCEDANPPGCEKSGSTGYAAARETLLRSPSVVRPHTQTAATRDAERAIRLRQAPPPVC